MDAKIIFVARIRFGQRNENSIIQIPNRKKIT